MCHNIKTISKSRSGELSICESCNIYHLQFNNIYFELDNNQFTQLRNYIMSVEMAYWEHKYACSSMKRKIPIPSLQENLVLMFTRQEIDELKSLFDYKSNKSTNLLNLKDIDYTLIIN